MNSQIKTISLLIILIIIVIIGWLWYGNSIKVQAPPTPNTTNSEAVSAEAGLTTSATDTSNAALQSDLDSVDAQMNGLNTDTTNIDSSLNQ
jgi:hypothetical protein